MLPVSPQARMAAVLHTQGHFDSCSSIRPERDCHRDTINMQPGASTPVTSGLGYFAAPAQATNFESSYPPR
jgi:hypothetical protein